MQSLAQVAEAIAATTKKNEKVRLLADYFRSRTVEEAAQSAIFLAGGPFARAEQATLQIGGRQLWALVADISKQSEGVLGAAYRKHGDLGAAAFEVLSRTLPSGRVRHPGGLNLLHVAKTFCQIAEARSSVVRTALLRELLEKASPLEAKYLIKIMTGELRIGLKESLVEEAIARAYGDPVREVQRANMLLGDIGETLRLGAEYRLGEARMRLFHPIGFMLASPAASPTEAFESFQHAQIEDKYDGIRAQAHVSGGKVRTFSRTLDDITESFPELPGALAAFQEDVILDGEILAWDFVAQRALPFSRLQARLGRKRPTAGIMREIPVAYLVFDVLYAGKELVIDRPLSERGEILERLFQAAAHSPAIPIEDAQGVLQFGPVIEAPAINAQDAKDAKHQPRVIRAPFTNADSADNLLSIFEAAQARGNEGLMIKDVNSAYAPGRRGKSWLKLKRELATLDVVVTAVERGHGRRVNVLSDYTFAVRADGAEFAREGELPTTAEGEPLLNVGKAYSGLTDAEIAEMSRWFEEHTVADNGWLRQVEPKIVIEVAFNAVMRSDRHNSGYALRFPRIVRLRPDKTPEQADTIERVREIYGKQGWSEAA